MILQKVRGYKNEKSIRMAQSRGILTRYIKDGYVCYDLEEYEWYLGHPPRVGRPPKRKEGDIYV